LGGDRRVRNPHRRFLHWTRRAVQVFFLSAFVSLSWAASYPPSRLPAENLFLRVDPLGALDAFYRAGAFLPLWPALALLFLSLLSGRFFCGWVCPLGSALELVPSVHRLRKRRKIEDLRPRSVSGNPLPAGARRIRAKYLLLLALVVLFPLGVNLLWLFDPLVIANRSAIQVFAGSIPFVLLGLLALAQVMGPRFWCQEICPLGALLSATTAAGKVLGGNHALLALVKEEDACIHCGHCASACPFAITEVADLRESGKVNVPDCALCGECVKACPVRGALALVSLGKVLLASRGFDRSFGHPEGPEGEVREK
jgi:polyferredoxin